VGLQGGNTCSFIFKVTLLTLSSLHMEYIPYVVMPTFKEGHIPTRYLIEDQVAPEHFWGLIHQGARPRINPCPRHGYPGPCPGALDISRGFNCLVPDQEPQSYTGGPLRGLYCLVPDQEPQECTGGPSHLPENGSRVTLPSFAYSNHPTY
jgi:hypothetical protein